MSTQTYEVRIDEAAADSPPVSEFIPVAAEFLAGHTPPLPVETPYWDAQECDSLWLARKCSG